MRVQRSRLLSLALALALPATASAQDTRPTVAILNFNGSALVKNAAEYGPLSKGIADMLITELSGSPGLRVVERDRIQALLEEQNLAKQGRIDEATAVKLGKILGAKHMVMGGFLIDPKETLRLDARAVDVETSQIIYTESVTGKSENILTLITDLGQKMNARMKLPPIKLSKIQPPEEAPGAAPVRQGSNEAASRPAGNKFKAVMLMSRALNAKDQGDMQTAVALLKQANTEAPLPRTNELLAQYTASPGKGTERRAS
ncbi:MAG: CsgG/HfaB family protein [Gemmatimonadales bacterium]|nr:CsgG/HfaB family protein [Gemmatimonadales bacterium]